MSLVTLETLETKQTELAQLIQQFRNQSAGREIEIDGNTITLAPGEHYAGMVLGEDGTPTHHLVLMAQRPGKKLGWQAATDWAGSVGGILPTRQEQALLYANCKPHLEPTWHWSSETHEDDASYAWGCGFGFGYQGNYHKSYDGAAVAVRLIQLTT